MSNRVEIVEVSPRDGLQNEAALLSTAQKLDLISRALESGLRRIEVTSFVHPERVPQMADAEAVAAGLPDVEGARYIGLTLNRRGFDRAVAAGLHEANCFAFASETFNRRNQGAGTFQTVEGFGAIMADKPRGMEVGFTIGAAFGCPFEGEVPLSRLMQVVEAVMAHGPAELALGDTIGVATPHDVAERIGTIRMSYPNVRLRLHLHNTRNTGIANAWAGIEAGVRVLDASLGGVGGCPFAPRATGNIATEDLVYLLDRSGVETGVSLDKAIGAAAWLEAQLGRTVPGMVMKAGGFPSGKV